ncbi:hypothetical protein COLO4_16636 [Corchorus olitorius]|uniref:Uncharacterized protein n=1 Tax=Corchorus olitorius TaxID=93759 RepID=A0A1R3JG97_9ROSI|nr:hypothetical protein COLO4_16636 [Corchorus olitorius]
MSLLRRIIHLSVTCHALPSSPDIIHFGHYLPGNT